MAAHDAGQTNRLGGVGDHEEIFIELDVALIQQFELLAFAGATHDDGCIQHRRVIGMHGLTGLDHDVGSDIN